MNNPVKFKQLWQLISALFREIIREPGVLFWGILFPILMSLGPGLAFTKKADVVRKVAIISTPDKSVTSTEKSIVNAFLQKNCEINPTVGKDSWQWKYIIKDEK